MSVEKKTDFLPSYEFPSYGKSRFTEDEENRIRILLEKKLGISDVKFLSQAKKTIPFVATSDIIERANNLFGPQNWSCSVSSLKQEFVEEYECKYACLYSGIVRVTLKDGTYREDVGCGYASNESLARAIADSKKIAMSDALKRALRLFGNAFGNCLKDSNHAHALVNLYENSV